jgi:hypothetical protein
MPDQVAFKDFVKIGWFPPEKYFNMAIITIKIIVII